MKKKLLLAIIIFMIILTILLAKLIDQIKLKNEDIQKSGSTNYVEESTLKERRISKNTFYIIENLVQSYITAVNEQKYENVLDMLSKKYIDDNMIGINNIENFIVDTKGAYKVWLIDFKMLGEENNIENYSIHALVTDSTKNLEENVFLEIYLDKNNNTFSIVTTNKTSIDQVETTNNYNSVKENKNNKYSNIVVDDEELLKKYMSYYRYNTLCNIQKAYELLDVDYRNKRFGNIEEYQKYLEENKMRTVPLLVKYAKSTDEQVTTYVCIDANNNYYIFKETNIMKYSLILDTYTVDLPEFIEKYNSASDKEKVILNINKFEEALNYKDYKYAYNCLSEGFKGNYFVTLEDFQNYINQNWYNGDFEVEYEKFEEDSGLYKYTISIINKENVEESFEKTRIMKLKEDTAFEMSFNI